MTLPPTLSLMDAADRLWEFAVVGAGPAGALAAHELARRGSAVLLLDKTAFPRDKVCGSCLNGQALSVLERAGLGDVPMRLGGVALRQFTLASKGQCARLPLASGMAVSRGAFDAALVQAAIKVGVEFLPEAQVAASHATNDFRSLRVRHRALSAEIRSRVVVLATGLTGARFLAQGRSIAGAGARIGVGTIVQEAPAFYESGTVYMAYGAEGYLGVVRAEDGRVDVAAALNPGSLRTGTGTVAQKLLASAGFPRIPGLDQASWRGTLSLTRKPASIALSRLFLIGDAAGYVEPFTGEGIGWALASAEAVVPLVQQGVGFWEPALAAEWTRLHQRLIGRRQYLCGAAAAVLRKPFATRIVIAALSAAPWLARPFIDYLNDPRARSAELDYELVHPGSGYRTAGARNLTRTSGGGGGQVVLPHRGRSSRGADVVPPVGN